MILAIIFEVLSLIVKIAGVLMEKKLDIAVGVMQLIAGKNFIVTYCTASDLKQFSL